MIDIQQTRRLVDKTPPPTAPPSEKSKAWLTGMLDKVMTRLDENSGIVRHSEPKELIVCLEDSFSANRWDEDTIHHLMLQLPKLNKISFVGHGNPFVVLEDFSQLLSILHETYGVECHVEIAPSTLATHSQALLDSPITHLAVLMESHHPTQFNLLTGQVPSLFLQYQQALYRFLTKRLHYMSQTPKFRVPLQVWVNFKVNQSNYKLIPAMLQTAEQWGVQGVRFINYASLEELKFADAESLENFQMPLYQEDRETTTFLNRLQPEAFRVAFELPTLIESQRDKPANRFCEAPYSTVTMDTAFNTSPCPKWALLEAGSRKIWQGDFWNASHFQYARAIHQHASLAGRASASPKKIAVPDACINCAMNCGPSQKQGLYNAHLLKDD
jgi:hypothetical protein